MTTKRRGTGLGLAAAAAGVAVAVAVLAPTAGCCLATQLGGAFTRAPDEAAAHLSPAAGALVRDAFQGIEAGQLVDHHVHVVGLGAGDTGAFVHPRMRSMLHPLDRFKYQIYRSASGIEHDETADQEYVARLVALAQAMPTPPVLMVFAFDKHHRPDGTADLDKTEFFVPNDYVFRLAAAHPALFRPVMSVHPYRPDALEALERWAGQGGRFVKWLPNSMGIDPAADRLDPFYAKMASLKLVLITHAGEEQAVHVDDAQELGNPLRLRKPLDAGVRVIVAHCASLGDNLDLDAPDPQAAPRPSSFDLFLRLMAEPRYEGRLFGDLSATLQFNRLPAPITTLLTTPGLHERLVNGSDYPLPAINALVRTRDIQDAGLITAEQRSSLNEIYDFNPLLYDFVLKRTLRGPNGERLPASVFLAHPDLR